MQVQSKRVRGAVLAVLTLAVGALGAGADAPPRKVDAGGLSFEVPASWKSATPKSSMRRAQLEIGPVGGDKEAAELVVFAFPGGAGGVEENVKRWESGFKDAPKAETKVVKGKNVEATRVEISGHYIAAVAPGSPQTNDKPNYRLLGAIVLSNDTGYFFKLVGPDKTVREASKGFDALLSSLQAGK